jgi:hypothetical protein
VHLFCAITPVSPHVVDIVVGFHLLQAYPKAAHTFHQVVTAQENGRPVSSMLNAVPVYFVVNPRKNPPTIFEVPPSDTPKQIIDDWKEFLRTHESPARGCYMYVGAAREYFFSKLDGGLASVRDHVVAKQGQLNDRPKVFPPCSDMYGNVTEINVANPDYLNPDFDAASSSEDDDDWLEQLVSTPPTFSATVHPYLPSVDIEDSSVLGKVHQVPSDNKCCFHALRKSYELMNLSCPAMNSILGADVQDLKSSIRELYVPA